MSKKGIGIILVVIVISIIGGSSYWLYKNKKMTPNKPEEVIQKDSMTQNVEMKMVLSLEDKITENSSWCGTFNLIWNDLKNDIAKQDIVLKLQLDMVKNLNKGTFNTSYLSEDSYYKIYGMPSLALKEEIEKAIQEKFKETSDILNDFNWENHTSKAYFLYAMLKKQFEFPKVFTELEEGEFGTTKQVKYFGIDKDTEDEVRRQVEVLYYNSSSDFAIQLYTKQNDEVIIARGREEETFGEAYQNIEKKAEEYEGNRNFEKTDYLKIPNIKFNLKEEIQELKNQYFELASGEIYQIEQALQTIQFELDKKGGKIKSEAGMMMDKAMIMQPEEPREFLVDDTFMMFLKEENKELPYFATQISDIKTVQNNSFYD